MSSVTHKSSPHKPGVDLMLFTVPQSLLLQVGTASIMAALLVQKAASQTLQAIGEASEEVFRGDRLPVLNFPPTEDTVSK